METRKVLRRMRVAIIVLSVLLFLSVSILAGILLYQHSLNGQMEPAVAPDNIIRSEELSFPTTAMHDLRLLAEENPTY